MFDDLVQECGNSLEWPSNLLNSSCIKPLLCDINKRLQLRSPRLFIPESRDACVEFMEVLTGETHYECDTWKNKNELETHFKRHLEGTEKDPLVRYLFLNAGHSRAPLNCTLAMFAFICTYHHILPEFTDLVYTFGQSNIDDFSHARFIRGDEDYECIPELSRSDRQSRIAYKLFAMEESDFDGRWTMRQTVVYHSLDLNNGRMFWLVLKANGVIRDRIKENEASKRRCPSGVPTNIEEALVAAFKTHMTLLEWSCEGWRWYLTQLEQQAKRHLVKVTAAPIPSEDKTLNPVPGLVRSLSLSKSETPAVPRPLRLNTQRSSFKIGSRRDSDKSSMIAGLSPPSSPVGKTAEPSGSPTASNLQTPADLVIIKEDRETQVEQTKKRLNILKDFSLDGLQSLTSILSKVNEAKTAMIMNIRMAEDLRSYYEDIFNFGQLDKTATNVCANEHRRFQWKARSLERLLEMECLRADALAEKISNYANLYDTILQTENREIDKLFSMSAQDSAERMEDSSKWMEKVTKRMYDIAKTTERDTSSMHVITLFTLLFLPGTFLGVRLIISWGKSGFASLTSTQTFFSTPIFGDPDAGTSTTAATVMGAGNLMSSQHGMSSAGNAWSFNWQLFWLFLKICLPMMVVTITVWVIYMIYKSKKRSRAERGQEGSEKGDDLV